MKVTGIRNDYTADKNHGGTRSTVRAQAQFILTPDDANDNSDKCITLSMYLGWEGKPSPLLEVTVKDQNLRDQMTQSVEASLGKDFLKRFTLTGANGKLTAYINPSGSKHRSPTKN